MDGVNTMNALMDRDRLEDFLNANREKLKRNYERAKGIEENKEKLLSTLDRRKVSFKKHEVMQNGYGIHKVEFKLDKLKNVIDSKSLFSLNWKFGKQSSWKKKGVKESPVWSGRPIPFS